MNTEQALTPLGQWLGEDHYTRQESLSFAQCDRNRRIKPAALLTMMAAAGGYDYDARGLTYEKLYEMGHVFLLSRLAFRVHRYPLSGQTVTMTTWEDGARAAHMRRVFEITGPDGALQVSGRSEWILVDPKSRKILRPSAFTARPFTTCKKEIDCPECRRVPPPGPEGEGLGLRPVRWSDLDGNGHVFSGNYGNIIWDALPADLQDRPLREFQINYHREAVLGDELELRGVREADGYRMSGGGVGGMCFTCQCIFMEF